MILTLLASCFESGLDLTTSDLTSMVVDRSVLGKTGLTLEARLLICYSDQNKWASLVSNSSIKPDTNSRTIYMNLM